MPSSFTPILIYFPGSFQYVFHMKRGFGIKLAKWKKRNQRWQWIVCDFSFPPFFISSCDHSISEASDHPVIFSPPALDLSERKTLTLLRNPGLSWLIRSRFPFETLKINGGKEELLQFGKQRMVMPKVFRVLLFSF